MIDAIYQNIRRLCSAFFLLETVVKLQFDLGSSVSSTCVLFTLPLFSSTSLSLRSCEILPIHCLRPLEIDKVTAEYFKFCSHGVKLKKLSY